MADAMAIDWVRNEDDPDPPTGRRARARRSNSKPPPTPEPRWIELVVLAQDPTVRVGDRALRARVRVPRERLDPGPRGHRFHVVDFNATAPKPVIGHVLATGQPDQDRYLAAPDAELLEDARFRAQNVYAIASRTLDAFETALGRRIPWSHRGHQIFLAPSAFREANAFYDPDAHAIFFGYFQDASGQTAYNALSHDIVAHETTHAILDGLRARFQEPGLPDQAAFHEAFADIAALLSVFSMPEVVGQLIGRESFDALVDAADLTPEALKATALLGLGEELGSILGDSFSGPQRGSALRRSVEMHPFTSWQTDEAYEEPHRRGEILVAAVSQTFVKMWADRLLSLKGEGTRINRARAVEEGSKAAGHLLRMAIRGIDYAPPLEFLFADFLDAILVSDAEVAPDDEHQYRPALRASFGAFGIRQPASRIIEAGRPGHRLRYSALHVDELRSSPDEVYRFIWDNAAVLEIPTDQYLEVDRVWSSTRIGPDGFVVREIVATYVQILEATGKELKARAAGQRYRFRLPPGLEDSTPIKIFGGGALIFDQWGRAKYHQTKPLYDWARQEARLAYLVRNALDDSRHRFGFSYGLPEGQKFAILHEPGPDIEERW
jgi:hypothetical protein